MKLLVSRTQSHVTSREPTSQRSQRGVALIEVLISVLIFSFGVLGLIGLEASAVNYSVDAEDRNRASLFANDVASWMWLNGTATVPSAQYTTWQTNIANPALANGLPSGVLTITTPAAGITNPNSADIKIQWTPTRDQTSTTHIFTTRVILP